MLCSQFVGMRRAEILQSSSVFPCWVMPLFGGDPADATDWNHEVSHDDNSDLRSRTRRGCRRFARHHLDVSLQNLGAIVPTHGQLERAMLRGIPCLPWPRGTPPNADLSQGRWMFLPPCEEAMPRRSRWFLERLPWIRPRLTSRGWSNRCQRCSFLVYS